MPGQVRSGSLLSSSPESPGGLRALPDRARASPDLMLGSIGMPGVWDSGGAQA